MAIIFELATEFADRESAERFHTAAAALSVTLRTGPHKIGLHPPSSVYEQKYGDISTWGVFILPMNVGYGVACDPEPQIPLTTAELTELGFALYDFLKTLPTFRLAWVGWEVVSRLSLPELLAESSEQLRNGDLSGLVVHKDIADLIPGQEHRVPFDATHDWFPYRGEERGTEH